MYVLIRHELPGRRKLGGDVTETGRSSDQTWSSPVKFDSETVEE